MLKDVLWSDEAYFTLDGLVNRHNCVILSFENPKAALSKSLHLQKLCVWNAFSAEHRLQPFFFESTIYQENYTALLRDHLIPQFKRKRKMKTVVFQHDGAPPHPSLMARDFLASKFQEDK